MESIPVPEILTVLIMLICGYALSQEGLFGAAMMFVNLIIAGLLAFGLFEWIVGLIGPAPGSIVDKYADPFCLCLLFLGFLSLLRTLTTNTTPVDVTFHPWIRQIGGGLFGLATGYILTGVLFCILMTLPWHKNFLWYQPEKGIGLGGPDRIWLSTVHRASGQVFDWGQEGWFDADGSFVQRYSRYRRNDDEPPLENRGDFPPTLGVEK